MRLGDGDTLTIEGLALDVIYTPGHTDDSYRFVMSDRVFTGGLSWWPVYWVRFMGNVVVERYLDPLLAPEPGKRGNYVTLLARAQVALP